MNRACLGESQCHGVSKSPFRLGFTITSVPFDIKTLCRLPLRLLNVINFRSDVGVMLNPKLNSGLAFKMKAFRQLWSEFYRKGLSVKSNGYYYPVKL